MKVMYAWAFGFFVFSFVMGWSATEVNPGEPDIICGQALDRCTISDERYTPAKESGVRLAIEYLANLESI